VNVHFAVAIAIVILGYMLLPDTLVLFGLGILGVVEIACVVQNRRIGVGFR
jgi:hypothetical protein